jgi:hypothetical protein
MAWFRLHPRLPNDPDTILTEYGVAAAHRHALLHGLAENQAVKGIAMVERQVHESWQMSRFHR